MPEITTQLKVLVAEEQTLMRSAIITTILECNARAEITEASNYLEGITLANSSGFDVLVCDINLHVENVILIQHFRQISPSMSILVYTGFDERIYALPSIQIGAEGYNSKKSSKEQYKTAWKAIVSKNKYLSPVVQELFLIQAENQSLNVKSMLSKREYEVFQLLKRYKSTKEISDLLGLKPNTISIRKKRIFEKLKVSDQLDFYKRMLISHDSL